MRIKPIQLFPDDPSAEVQLIVDVNGTKFRHPSVGGIEWMQVGPGMSEKVIELPTAPNYAIRFEMQFRNVQGNKGTLQTAQRIDHIIDLPASNKYELYQVQGVTRLASVSAEVRYEVYAQ